MQTRRSEADLTSSVDANIARNIKSARERRDISQAELARRVTELGVPGFHQTTIARIEGDARALRASEAIAVCEVLKVTFEMLAASQGNDQLRHAKDVTRSCAVAFDGASQDLIDARRELAEQLDASIARVLAGADISPAELIDASNAVELQFSAEDTLSATEPRDRLAEIYRAEIDEAKGRYSSASKSGHVEGLRERMEASLQGFEG